MWIIFKKEDGKELFASDDNIETDIRWMAQEFETEKQAIDFSQLHGYDKQGFIVIEE
jgi:hypothetical protein